MAGSVSFFLNGEAVTIEDPSPDLLLIDYLRSPGVGLAGAKKGCGQGGCGACTVILSNWDGKKIHHRSINSCLRPVCALGGLSVTTVEGTGRADRPPPTNPSHALVHGRSAATYDGTPLPQLTAAQRRSAWALKELKEVRRVAVEEQQDIRAMLIDASQPVDRHEHCDEPQLRAMNPVAYALAANNGSQCGYCSVGFVMTMSAFLANNPGATKREIEDSLDGNICRCTGYRAILTGMKTFASDWGPEDDDNRMKCKLDDGCVAQINHGVVKIPFPDAAKVEPQPVTAMGHTVSGQGQKWLTPTTLKELKQLIREIRRHGGDKNIRMVHGNTSYGIYKEEYASVDVFLDIRLIPEYAPRTPKQGPISFGASLNYTQLIEILEGAMAEGEGLPGLPTIPVNGGKPKRSAPGRFSRLGAAHFMCRRTAGHIVRDAASVGGNSMLVLKHIGAGEPFPSDLFTTLVAVDAEIEYIKVSTGRSSRKKVWELVDDIKKQYSSPPARRSGPKLEDDIVLVAYHIPRGSKDEIVLPQKVALRQVNSHSILNATTRLKLKADLTPQDAILVFGGVAPYPWRPAKTEALMKSKPLSLEAVPKLAECLADEVQAELEKWADRMKMYPSEGFTQEYKIDLAVSFLYKAVVNALLQTNAKVKVPEAVQSSGEVQWGRWPVSDGKQFYDNQSYKAPVSQPYIKLMAMYQTSGQVHYTHEFEVPRLAVNAAFVQSTTALADYSFKYPSYKAIPAKDEATPTELRAYLKARFGPEVDLVTHEDIPPHGLNRQGMGGDQPIFAGYFLDPKTRQKKITRVSYVGQSIALIIADSEQEAIEISDWVSEKCVGYGPVTWDVNKPKVGEDYWNEPILSIKDAIEHGSVFPDQPSTGPFASHIWRITRPGSNFDWATKDDDNTRARKGAAGEGAMVVRKKVIDNTPCTVVEGSQMTGGQVHFYLETQACVAEPVDGDRFIIHPSSQSPNEMRSAVAMALGIDYNRIDMNVRQLGGAYGGKTEQSKFVAGAAAVAANYLNKPVRLVMQREQDTAMIGKRHPYYGFYQVAIDANGIIRGMQTKMWGDGGAFYDCSFIVSNCIQLRADGAYKVENFDNQIDVCRTNKAPNTAMRAFGDVQCKVILENAIDDAAFTLNDKAIQSRGGRKMTAEDVREKNMYERGDVTPFGQALSYCYMKDVWAYLKSKSQYKDKKDQVDSFNKKNKWRKRGVAMIPVKYGSGYNLKLLEQATAVVSIFSADGTIVIHQGGVDMGQGMMTKVEQIASYVLNVPMEMIHAKGPEGTTIPNPTSTGGSTGTAYNGEAVKQACEVLRERLTEFGYKKLKEKGEAWCEQQGINFWDFGKKGWAAKVPQKFGPANLVWQNLISMAYAERVALVSTFNAKIPGGEVPVPAMTYKRKQSQIPGIAAPEKPNAIPGAVDSFCGFTFSAACSVVELDVLTGEVKILSSDIVYDMGWSLNPAIDIGQVEGAFVQGIGYLLTEQLAFQPEESGPYEKGRLNSLNTWRYKPPAVTTIPLEMNTYLFPRDYAKAKNVPENADLLFSAKEVGEPPLVLATSVFFALKTAIRESRLERGLSGLFRLDAPATVQEVRRACDVSSGQLGAKNAGDV